MSVSNIPTGPSTSAVHNAGGTDILSDASMKTMSPEDILNYVRAQLGSIDGQMNDYKNLVAERQKKADELREAMALMREMKNGDGEMKSFPEEKYNRMMTLLAKNSGDPSAKAAYETFRDSYGGFHATEEVTLPDGRVIPEGGQEGIMAGADENHDPYLRGPDGQPIIDPGTNLPKPNPAYDPDGNDPQDMYLDKNETQGVMDNAKQALESINSDNEMVMMDLQKLMQQRNQITQFASNAMNVDNETKKGVIGNIR